jgi:DNA-binding CsgD family transcriptional regulator/tetratricopeptide (TPR) repeat protein
VAQSVGAFDEQATALKRVVKLWSLVPNAAEVAERPRDDLILELIYALTMTGALDDVVSLVDDELRDAAVVRDPVLRAALRIERTWALLSLGRNDAAALADGAESVIAMLLEAPLRRCVIRACVHLGWLMSRSHPAASHQLLERAWHLSQESEDVNDRLFATNQYATQLAGSGRLDEALALFLDRLPTAREVVSPPAMQTVAGCAWCLNDLGQYDDAVCIAEEALRRIGSPEAAGGAWIQIVEPLCEAWIALGRWDDASRLLAQAEKIQAVRPWSNNLMGVLYCDLGRIKEAEIIAERAWRRLPALEEDTLTRPRVMVRGLGAHVAMSRNEVAQVRTILRPLWDAPGLLLESDEVWKVVLCAVKAEADAAARERSTVSASGAAHLRQIALVAETLHRVGRRDAASVLQYEAELDRCHGSADPSRWQGAAEAWGAIGHLHDEAWALLRVAECHSTKGSRGAATDVLRRAGTIARQLGASPLLSEISSLAERANLGLDQPPPAVHGDLLGRLTERERQVLKLVAIGSSNQQIANHLFISPKTASVHVSHILAKLEVVSRTEAASIAHRFGLVSE